MSVLGFLPLLLLALLVAALRAGRGEAGATLREDVLRAALILGVWIGLGTEILGALHAIAFPAVLGFWLSGLAAAGIALAWRRRRAGPPPPLRPSLRLPRLVAFDASLLCGIFAVAFLLLVVAWLAPPQSPDSLGYHMGRLMHWIQNRNLAPYPTHDPRQLFDPPFAEMARMHLFLLTGSDRAGCLLQWFAAMGALLAASLVARDLGGGRRAQIFAAVFAATLPIGATQATSGKNDWVEALWLLAAAHFGGVGTARGEEPATRGGVVATAAAVGLAILTKVSAWFFAFPIAVLAILRTPRGTLRRLVAPAAAGIVLVAAMCGPFLGRNLAVFRNPVSDRTFQARDGLDRPTPGAVFSNILRDATYQLGTTSDSVNQALLGVVTDVHRLFGLDPSDPVTSLGQFQIPRLTAQEDVAGSPLQLLIVIGVGVALTASRRVRTGSGARVEFFVMLAAGYLLFCAKIKWQPSNCRLLLPLLALAAPLAAVVTTEALGRAIPILAAVLFVASAPFVLRTYARHLSFEPGKGVLATPRRDLYFARVPWLRKTYEDVALKIRAADVRRLGCVFPGALVPEYPLWVLLEDVRARMRIENVAVRGAPAALASGPAFADFEPELVVLFTSGTQRPGFPPEIAAAGRRYSFVGSAGLAGFYSPR